MPSPLDEQKELTDQWRKLALQFDHHRMDALQLLREVLSGAADSTRIRSFLSATPDLATHRHVARGSQYIFLGFGKVQSTHWRDHGGYSDDNGEWPDVDMREIVIYRAVEDGSLWARPKEEWEDGRFIKL